MRVTWGVIIFLGGGFTITALAGLANSESDIGGGGMLWVGLALLAWGVWGWQKAASQDHVEEPNAILKELIDNPRGLSGGLSIGKPPATDEDVEQEPRSRRAGHIPDTNQSGPPKAPERPSSMPILPDDQSGKVPALSDDQVTILEEDARPHDDRWCSAKEASILATPDGICPACGADIDT